MRWLLLVVIAACGVLFDAACLADVDAPTCGP